MFDNDSESIDHSELKGFLTTKGTKYTKEINNQESDDIFEFNSRSVMYAETRCPTRHHMNCYPDRSRWRAATPQSKPAIPPSPFRVFRPFRG